MEEKLFVIDFDGTIVSGHTHNAIIRAQREKPNDPEYINASWSRVESSSVIGSEIGSVDWKNIFETANQQGHHMAIASFNSYGEIIPVFLEKIGLDKEVIEKIDIITGLPADPKTANKNEYIQQAITNANEKGFSGKAGDVFLIDDSTKNINAAKQAGYHVIHAKKDGSHLIELQKKLEELYKLQEKPPAVDSNAKSKQLSESEQLKQQRGALESQRIETINQLRNKKLSSEEKLNLFSELDGIELSLKAKYDRLAELEKEKLAAPIVDSNAKPKQLSESELLEQKIEIIEKQREALEKQREEHLEEINIYSNNDKIVFNDPILDKLDLAHKENYDQQSKLQSQLLKLQSKECLGKIEKPATPAVDHDSKPKPIETKFENQGAVPKKNTNSVKPEINLGVRLKERSEQTKDSQRPSKVSELAQQQKKLEDQLKAKPKKNELWEKSQSPVSTKVTNLPPQEASAKLIDELKKRQAKTKQALQGQSTFFGSSGNSSTSRDTKTQGKTETASKQFS